MGARRARRPDASSRRFRGDDHGQLLLLAGILLVLSFVSMAFTLAQVADLDKRSAGEQKADFVGEYRFMREKLGTVLRDSTGESTDALSFRVAFDTTVESHRTALLSKGFDARITLVGNTTGLEQPECTWLVEPCPTVNPTTKTFDSVEALNGDQPLTQTYDGTSDGVLWMCGTSTPHGFIVGAVVHFFMSDGTTAISETVVYAVNHPEYKQATAFGCS